jgi:hypothetical protein
MPETVTVPVNVSSKADSPKVYFEATQLGPVEADAEVEVSRDEFDLNDICETIGHVATAIGSKLEQLKAKRIVVEFGVEIQAEAGHLTALIVKGTGKANLKVTVEWS